MGVEHPLDQEVTFTSKEMDLLKNVDQVIDKAIEQDNKWMGWDGGYQLRRSLVAGGVAMAKLLWRQWEAFYAGDDPMQMHGDAWETFKNDGVERLGLARQTVTKYTETYGTVLLKRPALQVKPIGALMLITPAAKENQLKDKNWNQLEKAHDKKAIREIIREVRGEATSSGTAVKIMINPEGHLLAAKGGDPYTIFGYIDPAPKTDAGKQARARIINATGIQEV